MENNRPNIIWACEINKLNIPTSHNAVNTTVLQESPPALMLPEDPLSLKLRFAVKDPRIKELIS
jgi:hypothetical protein